MYLHRRPLTAVLLGFSFLAPAATHAACGASFCTVNTGTGMFDEGPEGSTRIDLRFEFVDQNQPRSGSRDVSVGEIPAHHDELRTINRNLLATIDHRFSSGWSVGLTLPVVDRSHTHIHNHHHEGELLHLDEHWDFTEIGDVRLQARRDLLLDHHQRAGVSFGVKFPTGATDVENDEGDAAERSLQPGSGTTDLLLGAYWRRRLESGAAVSVSGSLQLSGREHEGFRPGHRYQLDLAYQHPLSAHLALPVQLNLLVKERDKGEEAEPEESGLTSLALSPGLVFDAGGGLRLYGFYQRPLYQHVNGVQLTAHWSAVVGATYSF